MPDMKLYLELIARSEKFQAGLRGGEQALKGFRGFVRQTGRQVEYLTREIGALGQAATALSTGLVLKKLFSLNDWKPIDDALLRTQVNLKATAEQMDDFKKRVARVAGEAGIDPGLAFQSAEKLSPAYKPADIEAIMLQADRVSDAMKAPYEVALDVINKIIKLQNLSAKDAKGVADAIITSRVSLENFDTLLQRLAIKGGAKKGYVEQLTLLRGLNKAGLDNPRAIMQLNQVLGAIDEKGWILEQHGIKVKGRDQLEVLKDLEAYMQKMRKIWSEGAYNKEVEAFFGAGGKESMEFVFLQLENFKKAQEEMARAAQIAAERTAAAEKTWEKQLEKIKAHLGGIKTDMQFIYDLAKKPFKWFADSPNATKAAGYTAAGASAAVLFGLALVKGKALFKGLGKTGLGVAEGKALEMAAGVTPVFVVNMPGEGILPGLPGGKGSPGVPGGPGGVTKTLPFLAPLAAAAPLWGAFGSSFLTMTTAGLAARDALRGGSGKNWISEGWSQIREERFYGNMLYDFMHPEVKNDITLNVTIDPNGRVISENSNKNTDFQIALNRGTFACGF